MNTCPICSAPADKAIVYGFPMHFCSNRACNCLFGLFSFIVQYLPFNGYIFIYEGCYPMALFYWLFCDVEEE